MEVLTLQIFVSLVLVLVSILVFFHAAKGKDMEHADRLAMLPLDSDDGATATPAPGALRGTTPPTCDAVRAAEEPT